MIIRSAQMPLDLLFDQLGVIPQDVIDLDTSEHRASALHAPKHLEDDSIQVVTIAGNDESSECVDGVGTAAALWGAVGISYDTKSGALYFVEAGSARVRRMFPAAEKQKSALTHALTSALKESGAIPIQPLVCIIYDFAIGNSAFCFTHAFVSSPTAISDVMRFDVI